MADYLQDEHFDLYQEIARSAFADMLHDHERNEKYFRALKKAIDKMHECNLPANVLDIGTGTGLLSMMAVKCGADSVIACEAFRPMADCAEQIMEANGMAGQIQLIKKRSTSIFEEDLPQRANILVTEVFDTELIGEGAIETFNHAHRHLLEKNCIVVPDSATIFVQVVESPLAWAWNMPKLIADLDGDVLIRTPCEINDCKGTSELHDIQLNQFPTHQFRAVSEPTAVFEFDWSGKDVISKNEFRTVTVEAKQNGTAQIFFMWWVLKMDQDGDVRISCAPHWAHEDFYRLKNERPSFQPEQNIIPWRDHWMQALYYAPKPVQIGIGEQLHLKCNRDEFSLWFDLSRDGNEDIESPEIIQDRPMCTCGFHLALSRTRIGQINQSLRVKKFQKIFDKALDQNSTVLFVSEGSLLGPMIAALKVNRVYVLDSNKYTRRVVQKYIDFNQLSNIEVLEEVNESNVDWQLITHIIGEPSFVTSILPWDNFYFAEILKKVRQFCNENVQILPQSATIRAVPVEFLDLHKIFAPFDICESFDLTIFDRIIEESSEFADDIVEAQPLWEYPSKALGMAKTVFSIDFVNATTSSEHNELEIRTAGSCNGIAFWTEYNFFNTQASIVSTGPLNDLALNHFIDWDMYTRQGVHLFWKPIESNGDEVTTVACRVRNDENVIYFNFT
ncbi:protein arginine N-methyltransferase 7 [Contarinia nasturtii]|uniref:protein arginine N-methyltransferase 7 n=1 Tax=Contarinia nasturtii TaxID=265458 RepID=UPI0012D396EC|nr:protein arginine N-methyltransferase 7 [Contarinia nasturtii]